MTHACRLDLEPPHQYVQVRTMEPVRRTRLPRLSASELRTIARCTARVLADSNRTLDIITAEEIAAQTQLRALLSSGLFEIDHEARSLFHDPIKSSISSLIIYSTMEQKFA